MIHREGYGILIGTILLIIAVFLLLHFFVPFRWIQTLWLLAGLVVLILFLQFFRNPKRSFSPNTTQILAPADGKVVVIEECFEPEFLKEKVMQISIFMSPFNVHVNRNPVSGQVKYFKYHPGEYLVAWHPKSSTLNERTSTAIETEGGKIVFFRQIAGAVARRIRYYIAEGDQVRQCQEMGFIKFGSRVDVFLPLDAQIKVKLGEKTRGGQTILATW